MPLVKLHHLYVMIVRFCCFIFVGCILVSGKYNTLKIQNFIRKKWSLGIITVNLFSVWNMNPVYSIETADVEQSKPGIDLARVQIIRTTENILMNPVLENYRKITQLEDDSNTNTNVKVLALADIIRMSDDMKNVLSLIESQNAESINKALSILSKPEYGIRVFTSIFNKYADNIFYSDPRRANLYLAGGAVPSSVQTEQYLQRNLILTGVNDVKEDLNMLLEAHKNGKLMLDGDNQMILDSLDDCRQLNEAFQQYFKLSEMNDYKVALEIVKNGGA